MNTISLRSFGKPFLSLSCFAAAFVLACWVIGHSLPFPEVPAVREKLDYLETHGDEFDALFIGSSRVDFQIVPSIFDRIAAENGLPLKSFNAGVAAMMPPEDGYMLDQILRRPHRRLRWAFIELMPVSPGVGRGFVGTIRASYWHDWERTRLMGKRFLQDCAQTRDSLGKRADISWLEWGRAYARPLGLGLESLRLFAEASTSLGRGAVLASRRLSHEPAKRSKLEDAWIHPTGDESMKGKELAEFESAWASLQQNPRRLESGDPVSKEALGILLGKLAKIGVTPVFLIPPTLNSRQFFPDMLRAQSLMVFDFSDPQLYPEFFVPNHRSDNVHLNAAGAEIFTRAIALRFVQAVSGRTP